MNLREEIDNIMKEEYSEPYAIARLCQDIVLEAISRSSMSRNVTIKGGVVMRNISGSVRRATRDLDLDFIKYSIDDKAIRSFVSGLNCLEGVHINIIGDIEELNHQDYKGKRIYLEINDEYGNTYESKIDLGVHKDLDIEQVEYCFDICFQEDGASLLMNSGEQIITEKLKSLVRFGPGSTRYKDIFDIYYLSDIVSLEKIRKCLQTYIYEDPSLDVENIETIVNRVERTFKSRGYHKKLETSKKNWIGLPLDVVLEKDVQFLKLI